LRASRENVARLARQSARPDSQVRAAFW
jgi:hypothetical protein